MKKRVMKKWIPKNTPYCYHNENMFRKCKWHRIVKNKPLQDNGYCLYLKLGDWQTYGTLLWDECKECGVSE